MKGDLWQNEVVGNKMVMMALRDRNDKISTWFDEKRNIYEDLKRIYGKEFRFIDAVAIMTDTDNSHGKTTAYYGDIYFSKE